MLGRNSEKLVDRELETFEALVKRVCIELTETAYEEAS
jgi:hypothetical protein